MSSENLWPCNQCGGIPANRVVPIGSGYFLCNKCFKKFCYAIADSIRKEDDEKLYEDLHNKLLFRR